MEVNSRCCQEKPQPPWPLLAQPHAWQSLWRKTTQFLGFLSVKARDVRVMKLYLIRHGETVDNVAQLYAGVRDSPLTVQGVLQAERLGRYLRTSEKPVTHIFTSDLQRAVKTAESLLSAQPEHNETAHLNFQRQPILREQDFGFYEGKPFYTRQRDSKKPGKDTHRSQHQDEPGFQDVESKKSMMARTNTFVAEHIQPLILGNCSEQKPVVAIVSHGIILSHLWRSILGIFSKNTVALANGLSVGSGGVTTLEHLGGWSNTGYLELEITYAVVGTVVQWKATEARAVASPKSPVEADERYPLGLPSTFKMLIKTVNGKDHLRGLKRARGVGSSQYDEGQKKIESFFKKTKVIEGE
ncbi:MAG: hypothetical protein Q9171_003034 [Xanthocarpia ochracea]